MKRHRAFLFILAAVVATSGIIVATTASAADPLPEQPKYGGTAISTITGTLIDADGIQIGAVQLSQDDKGVVQVRVNASNLKTGEHGIHIHAIGKCEPAAFTTAGGHFNPGGKKHGLLSPDGPHAGDMPGLTVAANGTTTYTANTSGISLTGGAKNIFDADGAALVIHAAADDQVTDATGNSGARVACAVIAAANPALVTPTAVPVAPVAPRPPATGNGFAPSDGHGFAWMALVLAAGLAVGGAALGLSRKR